MPVGHSMDQTSAAAVVTGKGDRKEGGNHTNQISASLQIAFVHFLHYTRHKPDLWSQQQHKHMAKQWIQLRMNLLPCKLTCNNGVIATLIIFYNIVLLYIALLIKTGNSMLTMRIDVKVRSSAATKWMTLKPDTQVRLCNSHGRETERYLRSYFTS